MLIIEKMYDEFCLLADLQYEDFMEANPNFKKTKGQWFLEGYFDSASISLQIIKKAISYLLIAKSAERKECLLSAIGRFSFTQNVSNKELHEIYQSLVKK